MIEQKRTQAALHRRDAILTALTQISASFLSAQDPLEVMRQSLALIGTTAQVSRVYIYRNLLNEDGQVVSNLVMEWTAPGIVTHVGDPTYQQLPQSLFGDWPARFARKEIVFGHTRDVPLEFRYLYTRGGVQSFILIPVFRDEVNWGQIGFDDCERERDWTPSEIDALQSVVNIFGAALVKRKIEQAEREQRAFSEAMRSVSAVLNQTLDLEEVLNHISTYLEGVLPHDSIDVFLLDAGDARIAHSLARSEVFRSPVGLRLPLAQTANFLAIYQTKQPTLIPDTRNYPAWIDIELTRWIRAMMTAPLILGGDVIGFIAINSSKPNVFTQRHLDWLQAFANQAANAIHNARLFEGLAAHNEYLESIVEERAEVLRRTAEHVEAILKSMGEGLIVTTLDGDIQQVNPAFETLTGYLEHELLHLNLAQFFDPVPAEDFWDSVQQTVSAAPWEGEMVLLRKDGEMFEAALTITALHDRQGRPTALVSCVRNISTSKELERLKDAFVSNVSHELSTPLAALILNLENLLRYQDRMTAAYQRSKIETAFQQALDLHQLVDDILYLSRVDANRLMLRQQRFDLARSCLEIVETMRGHADKKHISLQTEGLSKEQFILGDVNQIRRVILNLISNAVKYTPEVGKVIVRLKNEDNMLSLSVSDTGIGIAAEDQPLVFSRFYRAPAAVSMAQGTGLGLAITREIVHLHGGRIELVSEVGKGSKFTVYLPTGN